MSYFILFNKDNLDESNLDKSNFDKSKKFGIKNIENGLFKKLQSNNIHKKFKYEFTKEKIEDIFKEKITTDKVELIAMPELNERQLDLYLESYHSEPENLHKYAEYLSIVIYNQLPCNRYNVEKKFNLFLETQSNYWDDNYNCKYSLNEHFINRRFNNLYINIGDDLNNINNILQNNSELEKNKHLKHNNYLEDLIRDISYEKINNNYYPSKNSTFSNEEINLIYKMIPTEYLKYTFICNLLVTRTHCHLILNNLELLENIKPMINKYKMLFKYLIGYAWLTFTNEESKKKIKDNDRIVFDIETVNNLPIFPFSFDDINQNPYACITIDEKLLNIKNNCLSFNMKKNYEKYYGLCDCKEFERRLKIFITKKNDCNLLNKIDWDHCVITGSAMTACGMKYNPLMDIVKENILYRKLKDEDIENFYHHYYFDSDLDIICNHKSIYKYLETIKKLIDDIKILNNNINPEVENIHSATIILSEEIINFELDNLKKNINIEGINFEYIKKNLNNKEIKKYFYDKYYIEYKKDKISSNNYDMDDQLIKDYHKNIPYEELRLYILNYEIDENTYEKQDYEHYIYFNDIYPELKEEKNKLVLKISESLRYKIKSNTMRTIEIFKSKDKNFFSMISRFHMGFVRAFWNGKTLKCLPSYITSMMLQLSTDYKYFASIRDPIEIINKYRSRGFGILLNDYEKVHMAYFNTIKDKNRENKWIDVYKIDIKNKKSIESLFGVRNLNDDIFKPSKLYLNCNNDCFKIINNDTLNNFKSSFSNIIIPSLQWLDSLKCINDKGYVNKLDRNLIKLVYEKMNEN